MTIERPAGAIELDLERLASGEIAAGDGVGIERPYRVLDGEIVLALADNNPVAMEEAHPEKLGNALELGGRPEEAWCAALREAIAIIARHLPELHREMALLLELVVPVGYDAEKHLSASYQEAIGVIYMTLHPSVMTLAEALIHELSHNKLNTLFELDAVLENADSPLYASPVRPDPRPLRGVLLALHAFLPVAKLYENMIAAGDPLAQDGAFRARFDAIRALNREAASVVLTHALPTPIGAGLIEEMRMLDGHFGQSASLPA